MSAKDKPVVHQAPGIWAAPSFLKFKSCDLRVAGTWYRDKFTLEPDEAAVGKQVGADGGDGGPKIRSGAKAAAAMCPDAPFVAELIRVAGGVPSAPKTPWATARSLSARTLPKAHAS